MSLIEVNDLTKEFKVYTRQKGILNTLKTFFHRPFEIKKAVDEVSFTIKKGEIVGYIGPNGAGKSTTIKMLSGILVPSRGQLEVDGIIPHKNRIENALKIGVVFGQRTHLHWDIPVID